MLLELAAKPEACLSLNGETYSDPDRFEIWHRIEFPMNSIKGLVCFNVQIWREVVEVGEDNSVQHL